MKGKGIIVTLLSFIVAIGLIMFIYIMSIRSSLTTMENDVNVIWNELFASTTVKNQLLNDFLSKQKNNIEGIKNLNIILFENLKKRKSYEKYCQTEYVYLEFKLNESILNFKKNKDFDLIEQNLSISNFDSLLNKKIERYNIHVQIFNEYYTIFPNVLVAKYLGLTKKKYFSIKYGKNNEDPIIKSKEVPDWARDVDTTFLN
jgi:hypothetical protein